MPDLPRPMLLIALAALIASPLAAKDSLGVFSGWAAFRDAQIPRCYAIAKADPVGPQATAARDYEPYASVATWPERQVRGQLHFRLSRELASGASISLRVGSRSFALTGGGGDAWAADARMDAAIVAAMRSADTMRIVFIAKNGRRITDSYTLAGAATAMDAATLGCAPRALGRNR